jgi:hypothetical protein
VEGTAESGLAKGAGVVVSVAQECPIRTARISILLARWHPARFIIETTICARNWVTIV